MLIFIFNIIFNSWIRNNLLPIKYDNAPPTYEIDERKNKVKKWVDDFDAQAINISGGNNPNKTLKLKKLNK